jgi:hypothetical protein
VVEIPAGDPHVSEYPLYVGFEIYKGSSKICSGHNSISETDLAGTVHETVETILPAESFPDWCVVSFTVSPLGEAPVVDPGAPPPLPDLMIESLTGEDVTGNLAIHVSNVGAAAWVEQDIVAQVTAPDGTEIGTFTWPNNTLQPGQTVTLMHGGMDYDPATGVCAQLDPENVVYEERDRQAESGNIGPRSRYCRPLPDLSITDATWDPEAGQLNITLQNRGEDYLIDSIPDGVLDHADVVFWVNTTEGRPLSKVFTDVNMEARDSIVLSWPMGEAERSRMSGGYTLEVNPERSLAELDTSNNTFGVEGSARLRIVWMTGSATFCPTNRVTLLGENVAYHNNWVMHLDALVGSGADLHNVANWSSPELEIPWEETSGGPWCAGPYISDWFDVAGDEGLTIDLSATLAVLGHQTMWFSGGAETLTAANDFGGTTHVPTDVSDECFSRAASVAYDDGPSIGYAGCGSVACSELGNAGEHRAGIIEANGDAVTGYCWWSTTYTIYRQDPAGP